MSVSLLGLEGETLQAGSLRVRDDSKKLNSSEWKPMRCLGVRNEREKIERWKQKAEDF